MFVPAELQGLSQFIVWRSEPRPPAKAAKVPHRPLDGRRASVTQPSDWSAIDQALAALDGFDGLGFVFTAGDPFCGVDLDGCRDPKTGTITPWARDIIQQLHSYAEVSPSGCGVKVFLRGAVPGGGRRFGAVELYSRARYFALTGQQVAGTPTTLTDGQRELEALVKRLGGTATPPVSTTDPPTPLVSAGVECTGGVGAAVLKKALGAANGLKFARLWAGDTTEYDGDWSRADLALCRMLSYWADGDAAVVDALFRQSGLMRAKWDERRGQLTYGQRTIQAALSG